MLGIYLMGGFPECQHILKQHLVYIVVLTTYVGANQRLLFTIQKVITIDMLAFREPPHKINP
jgi:hypothetical protein